MALDRLGNTIATGQVFLLAGTVRRIDGDDVLVVVGLNGEHLVRVKAGDVVKVDDATAGGGGGGAPTGAGYVVDGSDPTLSAERVGTTTPTIAWDFGTAGQAKLNIPTTAKPQIAKLDIFGDANEQQLLLKTNAGQSATAIEVRTSLDVMLFQVTAAGAVVAPGGVQTSGTVASLSGSSTVVNFWAFMAPGQTTTPILVSDSGFVTKFSVAPSGDVVCGTVNSVNVAAHAARHQHGGADEIATATPAANAIPKADGSNKLVVGWLPVFAGDGVPGVVPDPAGAPDTDVLRADGTWGEVTAAPHASEHAAGAGDEIKLDDLAAPDDNTDLNVSTSAHGLCPKLPNDATQFLDGTGAFSVPAGIPVTKLLGSDHAIASTTATSVTGLAASLTAGTYHFKYVLIVQSSATGTGLKFGVNYSGTTTRFAATLRFVSTGTGAATGVADDVAATLAGQLVEGYAAKAVSSGAGANLGPYTGVGAANADLLNVIEGIIQVSNSGDLELHHGSEGAVSTTVESGSCLILTKVA